jgi:ABC-type branched-subunit amino acid transport system substrate-binding protein
LSAQATAAVAAKPTVVLVGDIAPITESFVKALRQQGYQGPIVANDLASDLSTLKTINDTNFYVDRYYAFVDDSSSSSEIKAIAAAAKAVGADPTAPFFMDGYAQTLVLMQALGKCGYPCSGPDLSQAIMGLGQVKSDIFPGGPAEFSQDWHVGPRSVQFYKWDGSKPVATGDPQPLGS